MASNFALNPERSLHLCIDMQRLFSDDGPWPTPWMARVLPVVTRLARRCPERTLFTRFIPPRQPEERPGAWRGYFEKWREVTLEHLDPRLVGLMPELADCVPPAMVFDKPVYSAFAVPGFTQVLRQRGVTTLIVTGAETDMCVLATALGAVDHGYRVILVSDALCSSSDQGHDSLLDLFRHRFSEQVELAASEEILESWTQ